jgi:hypothetical protein
MVIDSSGRVGIGTSSPGYKLEVYGDGTSTSTLALINPSATNGAAIYFGDSNQSSAIKTIPAGGTHSLGFFVAGSTTERLRIDGSGNVGIGTSSPATLLDISVAGGMARIGSGSGNNLIQAYTGAVGIGMWAGGNSRFYSTGGMIFSTNATVGTSAPTGYVDAMTIDSSGRVGIGTTSPVGTLHVVGDTSALGEYSVLSVADVSDATKAVRIAYDDVNDVGVITASDTGTLWKDLVFQPINGRVGIGTSSPGAILHTVNTSAGAATVGAFIQNSSLTAGTEVRLGFAPNTNTVAENRYSWIGAVNGTGSNDSSLTFATTPGGTGATERMRIDANGCVGVGMTPDNQAYRLQIYNSSQDVVAISLGNNVSGSGSSNGLIIVQNQTDTQILNRENGYLSIATNNTERARIDSSGRLLVGTSSASTFFSGASANLQTQSTGTAFGLGIERSTADEVAAFAVFRKTRSASPNGVTIVQNGDSIGNITFAATDGTSPIIAANIIAEVDGTPGANDMPGRLVFSTTADGAASPTERMRIDSAGQTSMTNPVTPVLRIENSNNVSGDGAGDFILRSNCGNTSSYHIRGNTNTVGNWYLYGNGTTSYSSDQRLKKNIETTRDGYLSDVMQLRVVKYNWKDQEDSAPRELGLIAQEVERVFPGLVQDDLSPLSDEDLTLYKQLKASVLPVILLKALQEAVEKIEALETRITATGID